MAMIMSHILQGIKSSRKSTKYIDLTIEKKKGGGRVKVKSKEEKRTYVYIYAHYPNTPTLCPRKQKAQKDNGKKG